MLSETDKQVLRERLKAIAQTPPGFRARAGPRAAIGAVARTLAAAPRKAPEGEAPAPLPRDGSNLILVNGGAGIGKSLGYALPAFAGARTGAEVAQVYAGLPSNTGEPPRRLVGWQKLSLAAGGSKAVSLTIKAERLAMWEVSTHAWKVPAGSFTFYVGGSSRDNQSLVTHQSLKGGALAKAN
jgi:hypothetical protein